MGGERDRRGLDRRCLVLPARQPLAAFGLGAQVDPQTVARRPAACDVHHRFRPAAHQLDLEFGHRHAPVARQDRARVVGQLDDAARRAQGAVVAQDVGAIDRLERHVGLAVARRKGGGEPCARFGAGMPGRVHRGRGPRVPARPGQRDVVFETLEQPVAGGLDRLHAHAPFLPHAQRDARRGEPAVGRVVVDGAQTRAPGAAGAHRSVDGPLRVGRHLQFQLDLGHRGIRRRAARARAANHRIRMR